MRPTILPLWFWAALILALALLLHPKGVLAEALAEARSQDVRVVLYTDECQLKSEITNLPRRATWEQGGATLRRLLGRPQGHGNRGRVLQRQDRGARLDVDASSGA